MQTKIIIPIVVLLIIAGLWYWGANFRVTEEHAANPPAQNSATPPQAAQTPPPQASGDVDAEVTVMLDDAAADQSAFTAAAGDANLVGSDSDSLKNVETFYEENQL